MTTSKNKKIIKESRHTTNSDKKLAKEFSETQLMTKAKTKIAKEMSTVLRFVYLFTIISSFTLTLLVGFKIGGFTLDPITYVVSIASSLTFTGITTFIVKLLNKS